MPNIVKANLLSRKTRSLVSIFGIGLSVALLLVMVGLVNGNIRDLARRIAYVGADVMVSKDSFGAFYPNELVNERWGERILREVEGVERIAAVLIESTSSINSVRQFNYVYGIDYDQYNRVGSGFEFVAGRPLRGQFDLILDRRVARSNDIEVGDEVEMLGRRWSAVGIVKEALGARLFVRRDTLTELARPGRGGVATLFYVRAEDRDRTAELVAGLKEHLGESWAVRDINELFGVFISSALGLREFMVALIGVCAVICFAVILLSMYNSIIERTREIGILKSLGATKTFIVIEIVKEALIITAVGILVGYLLTFLARMLVTGLFPMLELEMSPDWMAYSAGIALIASILGTLYPAGRATRLDPVVALTYQ